MPKFLTGDSPVAKVIRRSGRPIRGALRRLGLDVVPYRPATTHSMRQEVLSRVEVDLLVDVGANAGQYGRMLRTEGYAGPLLSVEPMSSAFAALEAEAVGDIDWSLARCALGDQTGEAEINIAGNSYSSSMLDMLASHVDALPVSGYVGRETVAVRRLDDLLAEKAPDVRRVYLKIDTQGFEDKVIAGSTGALDRIVAMELEVSFTPLYAGQKLFSDLHAFVGGLGFDLAWIEPGFANEATLQLLQADAIFVRRGLIKAAPAGDAAR